MTRPTCSPMHAAGAPAPTARAAVRLGCVSFLNARPLIEDLAEDAAGGAAATVRYDVPSRLLADLEGGAVDLALCPVIDYQRSRVPLVIVPAGGIGCDGPTLTVRLYSRTPFDRIQAVHVDSDSHTSVCLLRILLDRVYGSRPRFIDHDARHASSQDASPAALLLIGDKVVHAAPPTESYPHQLDLGEAWHELTDLPFVFAVWMARQATMEDAAAARRVRAVAGQLTATRVRNAGRIGAIAARRAAAAGWPVDLAARYLGRMLRYDIGPRQIRAIEQFHAMAYDLQLIDTVRPLRTAAIEDGEPGGTRSPQRSAAGAATPAT